MLGKGFLAVMAKPVVDAFVADTFAVIAAEKVKQIVSLLEAPEADRVGLRDEATLAHSNGIAFRAFPIPDLGLPESIESYSSLINEIHSDILAGKSTVIHCHAGIGRSGMVAAGVLVKSGLDANAAFDLLSQKRGVPVPDTHEQKQWVISNQHRITNTTSSQSATDKSS